MSADGDFNPRACTGGHTELSVAYWSWPDRADLRHLVVEIDGA